MRLRRRGVGSCGICHLGVEVEGLVWSDFGIVVTSRYW